MDGAALGRETVYVLLPMAVPGIASTMLLNIILAWNEAFWTLNLTALEGRAAHRLHRLLFEPGGPVLGEAVGRLDPRHRADPAARLVQPEAAGARPHLRCREMISPNGSIVMGRIVLENVRKSSGGRESSPVSISKSTTASSSSSSARPAAASPRCCA